MISEAHRAVVPGASSLLRQLRNNQGLSQMELSRRLKVSQRHICYVESGRTKPSRSLLMQWLEMFEAPKALRNAAMIREGYIATTPADAEGTKAAITASLNRIIEAHSPMPALVLDADWFVVERNESVNRLSWLVMPRYRGRSRASGVGMGMGMGMDVIDALAHPSGLLSAMIKPQLVGAALYGRLRAEAWVRPELGARINALEQSLLQRYGAAGVAPSKNPGEPLEFHFRMSTGQLSFLVVHSVPGLPQDTPLASHRVELWYPLNKFTSSLFLT